MTEDDMALLLGRRLLADADRLRLFMPDCLARLPLEWRGAEYEVLIYLKSSEPSQE